VAKQNENSYYVYVLTLQHDWQDVFLESEEIRLANHVATQNIVTLTFIAKIYPLKYAIIFN